MATPQWIECERERLNEEIDSCSERLIILRSPALRKGYATRIATATSILACIESIIAGATGNGLSKEECERIINQE